MIALAWREEKSVLWLCLLLAALHVAISVTELFLAPAVLGQVESAAPLPSLFGTIAAFTAGLLLLRGLQILHQPKFAIWPYFAALEPLYADSQKKRSRPAYPNLDVQALLKEHEKGMSALESNDSAGEAIWKTMTELLQNLAGFTLYLFLFPLARPRADSDRARDRGAQLPGDDARREVDLQPARGGGRVRPAHELHRQKSLRPTRRSRTFRIFGMQGLAARRLRRHAAHVPAAFSSASSASIF